MDKIKNQLFFKVIPLPLDVGIIFNHKASLCASDLNYYTYKNGRVM